METLTIHFKESIKEKILDFLSKFPENDLEILSESQSFEQIKMEVQKDYEYSKSENAEFLTVNEARKLLDKKYGK